MCLALAETEANGAAIDIDELNRLDEKYAILQKELQKELQALAEEAMGDTPINLNSPEQLSKLLFSRQVKDKKLWKKLFNLGAELQESGVRKKKYAHRYNNSELRRLIIQHSEILFKTFAEHCETCEGTGKVSKERKDGTFGARRYRCPDCSAVGVRYIKLDQQAGFGLQPRGVEDLSSLGFVTNYKKLKEIINDNNKVSEKAKEFVWKLEKLSKVSTYRSTFIEGIRRGIRTGNILHTQYMQAVTRTGRLSSRDPNLHNQPRGTKCDTCSGEGCRYCLETGYQFPIRRVFVSRWKDGSIIKADYSRLEFAIAVDLARCPVGLKDLSDANFDPHQNSANVIGVSRQDAKPHTFKPLYGGSTGTAKERAYYHWFKERYTGVANWQRLLLEQAVSYGEVVLPSGRIYGFPSVRKLPNGRVAGHTSIVNYPVQGFATADLVPCAYVDVFYCFKAFGLRSKLINEVHDEIVVDVYPGEQHLVSYLLAHCMRMVVDTIHCRYNWTVVAPIEVDVSEGPNWMESKKVPTEWLENPPHIPHLKVQDLFGKGNERSTVMH